MEDDTKTCTKCELTKPVSEFGRQSRCRHGLNPRCKACVADYGRTWNRANVESKRASSRRWRKKFPERQLAACRAWEARHPEQVRENNWVSKLRCKYGITKKDYLRMMQAQSGKCEICRELLVRGYVDHCHKTGKVRSLLCGRCNSGIGMFKEDLALLQAAIRYINHHNEV